MITKRDSRAQRDYVRLDPSEIEEMRAAGFEVSEHLTRGGTLTHGSVQLTATEQRDLDRVRWYRKGPLAEAPRANPVVRTKGLPEHGARNTKVQALKSADERAKFLLTTPEWRGAKRWDNQVDERGRLHTLLLHPSGARCRLW